MTSPECAHRWTGGTKAMTTSASGSGATAQGDPVFVLAGGVSLGAVRVGMLSLLEGNVTPDAIVGAAIGALNG